MKILPSILSSGLAMLALVALDHASAQYIAPTSPEPFAGFLNEALRRENPSLSALNIGGSERLRFEDHEGYGVAGVAGTPPAPNNDFRENGADVYNAYLLSKLLFHVGLEEKWWSVYVEGRSSLVANDERYAYPNVPPVAGTVRKQGDGPEADIVDLQQAYVTLGNVKEFPLQLKVGRQELSYGEERLIGAYAWNNIGRQFDAAKIRLQNERFNADFFTGRPVIPENGRFNVANDYDWFSGVYATTPVIPKNITDLYFLARNSSPQAASAEPSPQFPQPSARDIYTIGGRLKSRPGQWHGFDYLLDGAYQFGDYRDTRLGVNSPRLDQSAFMAIGQLGYTFTNAWAKPRLGVEYDYGSGDNNASNHVHGTFENLFPTNHRFYGSMDLVSLQNIQDFGLNLTLKPDRRVTVCFMGNFLWLADTHDNFYAVGGSPRGGITSTPGNGFGINPQYSDFLGSEFTVIAGYAATRFLQLEAGYGHFFHGEYIEQTWSAPGYGSRDADFAYAQVTFTF